MSTNVAQAETSKEFSLEKTETAVVAKYKDSPEVLALRKQLDVNNANSVMTYGQDTATEISMFADQILSNIKMTNVEDSGELLVQLNKIMNRFDADDFSEEEKKQGFMAKIFGKAKQSIEALLNKYDSMGGEVEKVYVQLKKYEGEINVSNTNLETMFEKNMEYFELLEKHILAGQMAIDEMNTNILPQLQLKAQNSVEQIDQVNYNNALQAFELLEQRMYDLELAKNVSLQTMPQIKLIQRGNYNLVRKINSAFIITIPIFKQSLTQAITLKRQAVQAKAMAALDEKTNELLLRNAENTALQSKLTAQLASGSSIKIETLEETWRTIVQGIEETKQIQDEARLSRVEGTKRLQQIQDEFKSKASQIQ